MKAQLIRSKIYVSTMAFVHGDYSLITRLYIPELKLAVTNFYGSLIILNDFELPEDADILQELTVEDELLVKAQEIARLNTELIPHLSCLPVFEE